MTGEGGIILTSIEHADEQQLLEMKSWFFKENIRIQQEKDMLLEERRHFEQEKARLEQEKARFAIMRQRLDNDKELFDKKTEVLILELRRLANDRERLAREKAEFAARKNKEVRRREMEAVPRMFFVGVNNELALKKRYRDLLKIFHPDNACGNTDAVLYINKEYNALKNLYC